MPKNQDKEPKEYKMRVEVIMGIAAVMIPDMFNPPHLVIHIQLQNKQVVVIQQVPAEQLLVEHLIIDSQRIELKDLIWMDL